MVELKKYIKNVISIITLIPLIFLASLAWFKGQGVINDMHRTRYLNELGVKNESTNKATQERVF